LVFSALFPNFPSLKITGHRLFAPFVTALLLAPACLTVPRQAFVLDDALSEKAVLNYAHQHTLQFGSDLVFTSGPLGFLTSRYFFAETANWRMVTEILFGFIIAAGVCLLASHIIAWWRWALVVIFTLVAANIDPRVDLLLYLGLLCWGLLCLVETGWVLGLCATCFTAVVAFGMLTKVSFLVIGGLSLLAIASDLLLRRRWLVALGMTFGLAAGFVLGWLAVGQALSNLGSFLTRAFTIMQGYDQTMGLEGLTTLKWRGVIALALTMGTVIIRGLTTYDEGETNAGLRRLIFSGWLVALVFLVWKHGFVRADLYHMGFFFGLVAVLPLALEIAHRSSVAASIFGRGFGVAACLVSLIALQSFFVPSLLSALAQPFRSWVGNLSSLCQPAQYRREMIELQQASRDAAQLPKLRKIIAQDTVDVFGQDQTYALFNGLNYHPRPVFQSFAAYNTQLMKLNEQFYLSSAAPRYVLFNLSPIDRKLPALEDARVFRTVLNNYVLVDTEGPFLLLKKASIRPPVVTLLREGTARPGEPISLSEGEAAIWLEVELAATPLGELRHIFFKTPKVYLAAWRGSSRAAKNRSLAPPPMLAAGFFASPLLVTRKDVQDFYERKPLNRPKAYSVELSPGTEGYWQDNMRFRIYKIERPQ
jgi:hypothetical protein